MQKTISLPDRYCKMLETEKERTGQSMSEIIRRALDLYFSNKGGRND